MECDDPYICKHCLFGISNILESEIYRKKYIQKVFNSSIIQNYLNKIYNKHNEEIEFIKVTLYAFLGILGNFTYSNKYTKILMKLDAFNICLMIIKDYHDSEFTESSPIFQKILNILGNIDLDFSKYIDSLFQKKILH